MKKVYLTLTFFLIGFILTAQKLPFQGYLEESGFPVNGTRTFIFELTDYGWTETIADVPIDNGIYNVVLGEITLLPDTIFNNINETPLSITIDGTNIGSVTLYKPLGIHTSANESNFELKNESDLKRGELIVDNSDAGELALYGANDSLNIRMGAIGGYHGRLGIFDSLGVSNGFIRARNNGGSLQLNKLDGAGNFSSAILANANLNTSNLILYGQNTAANGPSLMIRNYITGNEINNGNLMSGNYKRSGTDWLDNENRLLAAIGNTRDESGSDPTGSSGYLSLWGTNSFNVELTGKRWENNDFPVLNMFGNNDDGGTFWMRNITLEVNSGTGTDNIGNIILANTDNGGISSNGLLLTSNLNATGGGGIEVKNNNNITRVVLNGSDGNISSNRASDGGSAVSLFQNSESGGIAIQNAANENTLFYEAETNVLELKSFGSPNITLNGQTGEIITIGTVTADGQVLTSDKRLKKDITSLENSLSNTLQLRGASYYWKDSNKSQKRQIGVIAQEVEEIYPEFVHTDENGMKAVNYSQMTAVLIEAIKELNQKVVKLEKENQELSTAVNEAKQLSIRLDKLEKLLLENNKVANK